MLPLRRARIDLTDSPGPVHGAFLVPLPQVPAQTPLSLDRWVGTISIDRPDYLTKPGDNLNFMNRYLRRDRKLWLKTLAFVAGALLLSGCETNTFFVPTVEALEEPTFVAHRGGANRYPESSIEAFRAVANTDFPLEMDLRQLQDGTFVPQHDPKVDRNMIGITGPIEMVSLDEWREAHVKGIPGGRHGTSTTWDEVLDEFGGRTILVPELKDRASNLEEFASTIVARGLQSSILVQSFDIEICKGLAAKGLQVLSLFGIEEPDPYEIRSAGINFVGVSKSVRPEYLRLLKQAGLKVWPWTVNTVAESRDLIKHGADGVFSDDPWLLSEAHSAADSR